MIATLADLKRSYPVIHFEENVKEDLPLIA
jgi:hypothetical protein